MALAFEQEKWTCGRWGGHASWSRSASSGNIAGFLSISDIFKKSFTLLRRLVTDLFILAVSKYSQNPRIMARAFFDLYASQPEIFHSKFSHVIRIKKMSSYLDKNDLRSNTLYLQYLKAWVLWAPCWVLSISGIIVKSPVRSSIEFKLLCRAVHDHLFSFTWGRIIIYVFENWDENNSFFRHSKNYLNSSRVKFYTKKRNIAIFVYSFLVNTHL